MNKKTYCTPKSKVIELSNSENILDVSGPSQAMRRGRNSTQTISVEEEGEW